MVDRQRTYAQMLAAARALDTDASPAVTVARAAGLLAGRVGCRVREAHVYLLGIADEQGRDPDDVAGDVLAVLQDQATDDSGGRLRTALEGVLSSRPAAAPTEPINGGTAADLSAGIVQEILDALPGSFSWLVPIRDDQGRAIDFRTDAASPEAVDVAGRRGAQLVGHRLSETYPTSVDGPLWPVYQQVIDSGEPRTVGPYTYDTAIDGVPGRTAFRVRVHRLGPGLLVGWTREDAGANHDERIAQTERLANLGWGEWDLTTGEVTWSDELYRIYERDPALGPPSSAESTAMNLPEEDQLRVQAAETFERGETTDLTYRVRVGGRIKHLRTVADAVRDATGRPLKIYGIVQDVTSRETARIHLADVERQLREHQRDLAAEHELAAQLQHIILPIPKEPIDLPGLRVAVRYLPAERASRVGGDWYHAAGLPDGGVLLAIGDVAGHGLQAATTMAQLRHALTTLTLTATTDPAELLSHLNRLLYASVPTPGVASTATAVVARYEPTTRLLTWAQAGHPAPLRTRAGETTELPRPRGPLLGAVPDTTYHNAAIEIEPGDLFLLYTDGLVEHRDQPLQQGLAEVVATLNGISAAGTEQPLARLLASLPRANPNDDTCILAARPLVKRDV